METKHTVTVRTHLYAGDQLNLGESVIAVRECALVHTDCLYRQDRPKYGSRFPCHLRFGFRRVVCLQVVGRYQSAATVFLGSLSTQRRYCTGPTAQTFLLGG
jgi:hypothetical protein